MLNIVAFHVKLLIMPARYGFFCVISSYVMLLFSCNPRDRFEKDRLEIERSASAFDIKQGEASIRQSNENFMKAFKAGDSAEIANSFATDGKIMVVHTPAVVGRDNIRHFISATMDRGMKNFEVKTTKIWGDSSLLAEEGTYNFSDSAEKPVDHGKYIVLWIPESGNWKMFRDIWTSDVPDSSALKPTTE